MLPTTMLMFWSWFGSYNMVMFEILRSREIVKHGLVEKGALQC